MDQNGNKAAAPNVPTPEMMFDMMMANGEKALAHLEEVSKNAIEVNKKLLMDIVSQNADTEYGKKNSFADVHSVEDYMQKVPYSTYDDYAGYIRRMYNDGERGLMTNADIVHYALTSGSVNNPKYIPVSDKCIAQYSAYGAPVYYAAAQRYMKEHHKRDANKGRILASLEIVMQKAPDGCTEGSISAATVDTLKQIIPLIYTSPLEVIIPEEVVEQRYLKLRFALPYKDEVVGLGSTFMTSFFDMFMYLENNWELLIDDIEKGIISEAINIPASMRAALEPKLKPSPERAKELRAIFEQGFDGMLGRIWPRLDFISAIGTGGFAVYTEKLRRYAGPIPIHQEVYAASEALMAIAIELEKEEYVLIPDSGFYEFIPDDAEDDSVTYTIDQLEVGKNYEIVLTNLSGLYRYRIGDVVKVVGHYYESPKLCFVYRKKQVVSIAGEKTDESMMTWAVNAFSKETGVEVHDYSIYADTVVSPGRYVLLIEPRDRIPDDKHEEYRKILEEKISYANPSLGEKIKSGVLGPMGLVGLQPQTYYLFRDLMIMRGGSENQIKPVRVIDTPVKEKFFFALEDKR